MQMFVENDSNSNNNNNNNNNIIVIILFTTGFNMQNFYALPKVCIYFIVVRRDSDHIPVKNEGNDLHNRSCVFSMRGKN
jgi:hypothetical protein